MENKIYKYGKAVFLGMTKTDLNLSKPFIKNHLQSKTHRSSVDPKRFDCLSIHEVFIDVVRYLLTQFIFVLINDL